MKKYQYILFVILLCSSYVFAGPSQLPLAEDAQAVYITSDLKLIPNAEHTEDQQLRYAINAYYPQITGENLPASAQQFNKLIYSMVTDAIQQFKNYVKADMPHMETLPADMRHNTLNIDYDIDVIHPAQNQLVSVRLTIEGMQAGRAHPYHYRRVLNYDLGTGKALALKELFKPNTDYLKIFAKYANKKLNTTLQEKWMIADGTAPKPQNYKNWNPQADGLLITFDEYQVAPYAAGTQEVEIPYSELKKIISPKSPISTCVNNPKNCEVG